ncbi:MAG TPA: hypothetical protein C5S50_04690 [Methanosarcinaceae archaeon]|nr:hypothetical protein [Methanosarcinaceae archaeon]
MDRIWMLVCGILFIPSVIPVLHIDYETYRLRAVRTYSCENARGFALLFARCEGDYKSGGGESEGGDGVGGFG